MKSVFYITVAVVTTLFDMGAQKIIVTLMNMFGNSPKLKQ